MIPFLERLLVHFLQLNPRVMLHTFDQSLIVLLSLVMSVDPSGDLVDSIQRIRLSRDVLSQHTILLGLQNLWDDRACCAWKSRSKIPIYILSQEPTVKLKEYRNVVNHRRLIPTDDARLMSDTYKADSLNKLHLEVARNKPFGEN